MKKFEVFVSWAMSCKIDIEAETEEQARELVRKWWRETTIEECNETAELSSDLCISFIVEEGDERND